MTEEQRIEAFKREAPQMILDNEEFMSFLKNEGFFDSPASTKYHGVYDGGLFDHSAVVHLELKNLTKCLNLEWQRPESVFIIGMFHDICKHDQYIKAPGTSITFPDGKEVVSNEGFHYEYNGNTLLKGHGAKSVMILSRFITLTEEEQLCIRYHMGAYEKDEWTEFDKAIKKYPNVFYTHAADMIASKIDNV